ncbi:Protein Diaphanous-like 1 [Manis pentadactyla]|nr:Protein Diaphanous-like 1 [Manis pentadactyla]
MNKPGKSHQCFVPSPPAPAAHVQIGAPSRNPQCILTQARGLTLSAHPTLDGQPAVCPPEPQPPQDHFHFLFSLLQQEPRDAVRWASLLPGPTCIQPLPGPARLQSHRRAHPPACRKRAGSACSVTLGCKVQHPQSQSYRIYAADKRNKVAPTAEQAQKMYVLCRLKAKSCLLFCHVLSLDLRLQSGCKTPEPLQTALTNLSSPAAQTAVVFPCGRDLIQTHISNYPHKEDNASQLLPRPVLQPRPACPTVYLASLPSWPMAPQASV